jgi:hypothetical protein
MAFRKLVKLVFKLIDKFAVFDKRPLYRMFECAIILLVNNPFAV